jgi:hypothetical protein
MFSRLDGRTSVRVADAPSGLCFTNRCGRNPSRESPNPTAFLGGGSRGLVAANQPDLVARLRTHLALLWKVESAWRRPRP